MGGLYEFYKKKTWFFLKKVKKLKKIEKKWKKCIKSELLGASVAKIWKIMNEFHVKSSEHGGVLTNFT